MSAVEIHNFSTIKCDFSYVFTYFPLKFALDKMVKNMRKIAIYCAKINGFLQHMSAIAC